MSGAPFTAAYIIFDKEIAFSIKIFKICKFLSHNKTNIASNSDGKLEVPHIQACVKLFI